MILQALYDYYQRKAKDPDSKIAPLGWEWKEIPYIIVIDEQGCFRYLECTIEGKGKEKKTKSFLVTKGVSRTIAVVANRFWDHYGYVLAHPKVSKEKNEEKRIAEEGKLQADAEKQNSAFVKGVRDYALQYPENRAFQAVSLFYDQLEENKQAITQDELWMELIKKPGINLSFRILGEAGSIVAEHENCLNTATVEKETKDDAVRDAPICLITGEKGEIASTHSKIPIGKEANTKLLSFQKNSGYDSYYKEQGANAPVSIEAEMAYTTALNTMLEKSSPNRYMLRDTTVVFWAQQAHELEEQLPSFFSPPPKDDPDRNVRAVEQLLKAPLSGKLADEDNTPFYLLALAPNVARISVRFWKMGTVGEFSSNLRAHFNDLQIAHSLEAKGLYSVYNLLTQVAFDYKLDNLPPNLVGELMQAILNNTLYPATLQLHCMMRIRADRSINATRAGILKAYLNRKQRNSSQNQEQEITMSLDPENTNQAYLCGRLFAVLESIQSRAIPNANAGIKDRYYGAASTTPIVVFSRLLTLSNHHLSKIGGGLAVNFERQIQAIVSSIHPSGFPRQLSLDDQSRFAIGYYHQREAQFSPKKEQ